ncbi:VOC family protein [Legionella cardiaca]|uniref:VOC family protein n=1 Tax=Legionella cardiaca TaxID=1071983 RepID=A0ABY8AS87_9GAMM|nr:VOC family protein [Legionella cardiaca]WED42156.1 VOC family protein [Legionella cardiaca]
MTTMAKGQICWNELATSDVKKAKDFYGKVFGWQFIDHDMGEMTYTIAKAQDKEFAGIWTIPEEQRAHIPPHWMAYILVSDVASALENAKRHGANVIKEVTQAGDMGHFAIITDPTGAYIALWEPTKK